MGGSVSSAMVTGSAGGAGASWAEGDEVLGRAHLASLAEYVVADGDAVVAKPPDMPWDVAGALGGIQPDRAHRAARVEGRHGDVLLVHAAAGGAGTMAVQLARYRGAEVIGTASPANDEHLERLGVDARRLRGWTRQPGPCARPGRGGRGAGRGRRPACAESGHSAVPTSSAS